VSKGIPIPFGNNVQDTSTMFNKALAVSFVAALTLSAGAVWATESVTGRVVEVTAPDRLILDVGGERREVRLYGVDCPEPDQAHHDEALAFVKERALEKEVTAEILTTDTAGTAVARIILPDYVNLNHTLLSRGLGWWDEPNTPEDGVLKRYAARALTENTGLWQEDAPLAPWDYRRSHGEDSPSYSIAPAEPEMAAAPEPEETPTLSGSGTGRYAETENQFSARDLDIDASQLDLNNLLVTHQPRMTTDASGNAVGLTATGIEQIPGAAQLGFRNGDVITGLNGEQITDISQVYGLVQRNRDASRFQVNLIRDGRPVTLTITP